MRYDPYTYQPILSFFYTGQHQSAVQKFAQWLHEFAPDVYDRIKQEHPELLDGEHAAGGGAMGLSGMHGFAQAETVATDDALPITEWGQQIFQLAQAYLAYDSQKQLMKMNITRAEQGLAPISSAAIAPQLNVGMSPEMQSLSILALVALVGVGLMTALRK